MISSLDDAVRQLRAVPGIGIVTRPFLLLPLLRTRCLSVLLSTRAADVGWAERFDVELLSAEQLLPGRDNTNARAQLNRLVAALPDLVGDRWRGREMGVTSYLPPQREWLSALEDVGARPMAHLTPSASAVLEDKTAMRPWFRELGVATPDDMVVHKLDHQSLRRRFGDRYVVQRPDGSAGQGTYLVDGREALSKIPPAERWLVSAYAGDTSLNFHGLVSRDGSVTVLRPSVQLTDVSGLSGVFGGYSGCDFAAPGRLPAAVLTRGQEAMERIGWGLAGLGYVGVFGADFVVRGESVVVLEINCRMQASTWLLGEVELEDEQLPTMLRHVLECRGQATAAKAALAPVPAVQLSLRHQGPPGRITGTPSSGVYRMTDGELRWRGNGYGLLECGPHDCTVVNLPRPGTLVMPGEPLARLVSRRPLTTPDGTALNGHGRPMTEALYARFTVEPA